MSKNFKMIVFNLTLMLATVTGAFAGDDHGHDGDIIVGRTISGRLAVEFDFGEPIELPRIGTEDPFGLTGWANDEPGFLSLDADEPDEGFFALEPNALVIFELLSADPALKLFSPGFGELLSTPGDKFIIGAGEFDIHPTYFIDADDPAFDPANDLYAMSFRLLDDGATEYAPSEELHATIAVVPEPSTVLLVAFGAIAGTRRAHTTRRRERTS